MSNKLMIHGSMFALLKRFVDNTFGSDTWENLQGESLTGVKEYNSHANYPLSEMEAIIAIASKKMGISEADLQENFGEKMVPDLMTAYGKYINPAWKTFEILEYTEHVMHKAVRKEESNANPPILNVCRVHDKLLVIDYYSQRKMACLAVGIIKGIAAYYQESDQLKIICNTDPTDERVQIRLEFE